MANGDIPRDCDVSNAELERELRESLGQPSQQEASLLAYLNEPPYLEQLERNTLLVGKVTKVLGDEVWIEVGSKWEGVAPLAEWFDEAHKKVVPPKPGDEVPVVVQEVDEKTGALVLSYRRARRTRVWGGPWFVKEGEVVCAEVTRRVKGGLLVDIVRRAEGELLVHVGGTAFMPASQVGSPPPFDLDDCIGKDIECVVLKIDEGRRTVVVSRRKLIEARRPNEIE
jgi:small subunit ribosomal protein S1